MPGSSGLGYEVVLTRRFLKDDRLTVGIIARNFAGPTRQDFRTITDTPGSHSEYLSIGSSTHRTFGLRISYRFGSLNTTVKKTAASISNDDLQGRKKN